MSDSPAPWSPPAQLPDHPYRFTPVPRAARRRDGWSSDRQHAFVWALARLPSVAKAARSVGMSARSAYRLRDSAGAEAFAAAWDDAMEIGIQNVRDTALERALSGVAVPVLHRGTVVGSKTRFNDALLVKVLASGMAESKGLLAHQRRIADRRAVRDADARLGGPVDWGPSQAERDAAQRAWAEEYRRSLEELLARPTPPDPRRRPGVRSL